MCRILAYLGPELPLDELLLKPANSLLNQSKAPRHHPLLQLAGWGFGAWSETLLNPDRPLVYRRPVPAFFDDNILAMVPSLRAHTLLAHVRAAMYRSETVMADENCHPFFFKGTPWILAHNGFLAHWRVLQRELLKHCHDRFLDQMRGTTDTEFIFALLLSLLEDDSTDSFQKAFERLLKLLLQAMKKLDCVKPSKLKLALANANEIVAVNYGSGYEGETDIEVGVDEEAITDHTSREFLLSTVVAPLYVLRGTEFDKHQDSYGVEPCPPLEATTAILASEPLTQEKEDWLDLPFKGMIRLTRERDLVTTEVRFLDL